MIKPLIYFFLAFALLSCGETGYRFEEPQPASRPNLQQIPKRLTGNYLRSDSTAQLYIDRTQIIEWQETSTVLHIDTFHSVFEIDSTKISTSAPDTLKISEGGFSLNFKSVAQDSIWMAFSYYDTLFSISDHNLLKRFKGRYFLNYARASSDTWRVRCLTLKSKTLTFEDIEIPEDITALTEITEIKEIRTPEGRLKGYQLEPTRKELKQLMKLGLTKADEYTRLD